MNAATTSLRILLLGCLVALSLQSVIAGDWPRWRGPDNTGTARDESPLTALPANPKSLWQVELGEGFSSPVVAQGRVAIMDNQGGREVLHLLNAADGTEIWNAEIDDVFKDQQGPPGPRNTPLIDGAHIYAVSCKGELQCRRLADGELVWRTSYTNDLHATFIGEKGTAPGATRHGNNGSPLIDGPHLIAPVGGQDGYSVVCFDKLTGAVVWHSQDDVAGYGSPVVAELAGVKQVIVFTVGGLVGLRRDDGGLLWRVPMETAYGRHVMTPVVWNDIVVAGSHTVGLMGVRISRGDGESLKAEQAWLNKDAAPNFVHPVAVGENLFTLGPRKQIQSVNLATGELNWSESGMIIMSADKAYAGFIHVAGNILLLTDAGELMLFPADPAKCEVLGRVQLAGVNWCNPAYADGVLYLRDGIKGGGMQSAIRVK